MRTLDALGKKVDLTHPLAHDRVSHQAERRVLGERVPPEPNARGLSPCNEVIEQCGRCAIWEAIVVEHEEVDCARARARAQ